LREFLAQNEESAMTNSRIEIVNWLRRIVAGFLFIALASHGLALAAESFKKVRIAIPSIVIDFGPLWIAREKGFFRDERLDAEITYIQGNIRGVQALLAGEVQFGIAGSAGPIGVRAAGEDAVIVAVPMNRLDYTFVTRQPLKSAADLVGKKVGIGAVGGSDEVATRIALRQLGVDPTQVTMLVTGGSAERLAALRIGSVDAATVGGATFIGGGAGLYKALDLLDLGVEFPFTAIFTTRRFAAANRDAVLGLIRGYMRGVRFFQENKEEAITITARNLRTTNKDLLERQWRYVKDHVFEKIPNPSEKGFKLVFDMLGARNPKVNALRMEDVFDGSFVKELVDKGFFK
jgi:NitT/TauT family transport system substrate-binding protein